MKLRLLLAALIGIIPINSLKIVLYRLCFKYRIDSGCKLGLSLLVCQELNMEQGAKIGNFNVLYNVGAVSLAKNAQIGGRNRVTNLRSLRLAADSTLRKENRLFKNPSVGTGGDFFLGRASIVTVKHIFDLTGNISIGDNTVIGGESSQFWTHGFDIHRNGIEGSIIVKDNCYIGASCLINLGIVIESNNQIGMGTVISRSITTQGGFWTSNQLVRRQDCIDVSRSEGFVFDSTRPENKFYLKLKAQDDRPGLEKESRCK